ncbi:FAD-dependent oxidoreductase [Paraburkholderia strydomiana]|uniref:FAD-dependent oxidoreductase n=1 Tax=Paraburkholderia strydomiana TaxID=1245417 RepID=UPI0038BCA640
MRRRSASKAILECRCASSCGRLPASRSWRAATFWLRRGRVPNTAGIGLELAGVQFDERGYIGVNDRLQTSAVDVWAIG